MAAQTDVNSFNPYKTSCSLTKDPATVLQYEKQQFYCCCLLQWYGCILQCMKLHGRSTKYDTLQKKPGSVWGCIGTGSLISADISGLFWGSFALIQLVPCWTGEEWEEGTEQKVCVWVMTTGQIPTRSERALGSSLLSVIPASPWMTSLSSTPPERTATNFTGGPCQDRL